jgi:hypothetical protein
MEEANRVACQLIKRVLRRIRHWVALRHVRGTSYSSIMVGQFSVLSHYNWGHSNHNLVQALSNSKIRITINESKDQLRLLNNQQSTQ